MGDGSEKVGDGLKHRKWEIYKVGDGRQRLLPFIFTGVPDFFLDKGDFLPKAQICGI